MKRFKNVHIGVQRKKCALTRSVGEIYVVLIADHLQPTLDQFICSSEICEHSKI